MGLFKTLGGNKKIPKAMSIVSEGIEVKGDMLCRDYLYVAGMVSGDISSIDKAMIEIGKTGRVFGQIKAETIIIRGIVEGDVVAYSQLELGGSAKVKGRLSYSLLKLEPGAVFEGELEHQQKISESKSTKKAL